MVRASTPTRLRNRALIRGRRVRVERGASTRPAPDGIAGIEEVHLSALPRPGLVDARGGHDELRRQRLQVRRRLTVGIDVEDAAPGGERGRHRRVRLDGGREQAIAERLPQRRQGGAVLAPAPVEAVHEVPGPRAPPGVHAAARQERLAGAHRLARGGIGARHDQHLVGLRQRLLHLRRRPGRRVEDHHLAPRRERLQRQRRVAPGRKVAEPLRHPGRLGRQRRVERHGRRLRLEPEVQPQLAARVEIERHRAAAAPRQLGGQVGGDGRPADRAHERHHRHQHQLIRRGDARPARPRTPAGAQLPVPKAGHADGAEELADVAAHGLSSRPSGRDPDHEPVRGEGLDRCPCRSRPARRAPRRRRHGSRASPPVRAPSRRVRRSLPGRASGASVARRSPRARRRRRCRRPRR